MNASGLSRRSFLAYLKKQGIEPADAEALRAAWARRWPALQRYTKATRCAP
jgi:hypothetical protein